MGWGTGTFTSTKHLFDNDRSTSLGQGVEHDTIVAMATDTGGIGVVLYVSFLVMLFRSLMKRRTSDRSPEGRDFTVTCLAILTIFVINGTFADARFWMPQNAIVFFLAGLALAIRPNVSRTLARDLGFPGSASLSMGEARFPSPWAANTWRFRQQLAETVRSRPH